MSGKRRLQRQCPPWAAKKCIGKRASSHCMVTDRRAAVCAQALEAAIERGLPRVEAGAQGEHKLQRGYMPSMTHSSHYIRDPLLRSAIDSYLSHERVQIQYTMEALVQHVSPYKDRA